MTTLSEQLCAIAKNMGLRFSLKGASIPAEKVFGASGLLPAILRRADQLCSFCLGHGLGVTFERSEQGMLGVGISLDDKVAGSVRLLCALDIVIDFVQRAPAGQPIAVDDLMVD
jgi:intracellular multiplication protein IcmS